MSNRLHWCYNDYMNMPITQLLYWAKMTGESIIFEKKEIDKQKKLFEQLRNRK